MNYVDDIARALLGLCILLYDYGLLPGKKPKPSTLLRVCGYGLLALGGLGLLAKLSSG